MFEYSAAVNFYDICKLVSSCHNGLYILKSISLILLSIILGGGALLLLDEKKVARRLLLGSFIVQIILLIMSSFPSAALESYGLEWLLLIRVVNYGSHVAALLGNFILLMYAWELRFPHDFFVYFTTGISILIVQLCALILPELTGADSNWSSLPGDTLLVWSLATLTSLPVLLLSRDLFFARNVDPKRLWRPILLFTVACVVACGFSVKLQFDEIKFLSKTEDLFLNSFKATVESRIEQRADFLKLLIDAPRDEGDNVESNIHEIAKGLVTSNQTNESVFWLDSNFKEVWRVSELQPDPSLDIDRIKLAVGSVNPREHRVIHLFSDPQENSILVILPYDSHAKVLGYIVACFRLQEVLARGYERLGDNAFQINILGQNDEVIYSSRPSGLLPIPHRTGTFNIFERHVAYQIAPSPAVFSNFITFLPKLILFLGIIAAIHLGHLLYVYSNLQTSLDEVETRVIERTKELSESKLKAEEASQTKSQFLANISHEIRTPLNVLTGASELLAETNLEPQQRHYVNMFRQASDNLLRLVNDIIDLSKVESGQVLLEEKHFSLKNVIEELAALYRVKAAEKGIQLLCHMDHLKSEFYLGDALRIKQIVGNILSNAIKFTDHGGVTMTVSGDRTRVQFRISDTGIGIASDKLDQVFERFIQMDSSLTRNKGGAGLGLTIAKNLVELMGGQIRVFSQPGQGTTFLVTVSLKESQAQNVERKTKSFVEGLPSGLSVLITDDSIENRELLKIFLSKYAVYLEEADNGFSALEKLNNKTFDFVIMDMQMPVLDGYSAVSRWRQIEKERGLSGIPILALTAHALSDDSRRCIDAGCSDYLSKPVTKSQLVTKIAEMLQAKYEETDQKVHYI